ncbi:PREDICTED: ras-related protein Rab-40C isoform X2 [Condylura cristata]|uniref:ras-related protein Rab-40C isoform X2 n=1 Tax=Condylura cristata TaxID=143302 RepID=UPI000642AA67|nr:PREDICTED: ras-related protein Rab-40C isoform X2 [Condylura cristata]
MPCLPCPRSGAPSTLVTARSRPRPGLWAVTCRRRSQVQRLPRPLASSSRQSWGAPGLGERPGPRLWSGCRGAGAGRCGLLQQFGCWLPAWPRRAGPGPHWCVQGKARPERGGPGRWAPCPRRCAREAPSSGPVPGPGAGGVRVAGRPCGLSTFALAGIDYKTTTILLDGRRVKLELWDTSGQGRFCTIFRSYSRGAQGILLVYDITNRWSFDGIDRWIKEIDERQVRTEQARAYAEKNGMTFFEVSPLCNFNVTESFTELSRIVLMRHGMEKIWRPNRVFSLQDLCCRAIVSCTPVHLIDKLPLPVTIKSHLKSFSMANGMNAVMMHGRSYSLAGAAAGGSSKGNSLKRSKSTRPPQSPPQNCSRSNCKIS